MTIKELINKLKEYDENTLVIVNKWSYYSDADTVDTVRVLPKTSYYERFYVSQYRDQDLPNSILAVLIGD
jgi:hypothetical protein